MLFRQLFLSLLIIYSASCYRVRLTCEQVRSFVDIHNLKRFHVARGLVPGHPAAADMKYMVWDDELAEKAARWSENGKFKHNPNKNIWSKRWDAIGENIYTSTVWPASDAKLGQIIKDAMESWFNEYKDYRYQPFHLGSAKPIGHYTQMVWADTTRVGCGVSQQRQGDSITTLVVCDYGPAGNFLGKPPYLNNFKRSGFLQCFKNDCYKLYGLYC